MFYERSQSDLSWLNLSNMSQAFINFVNAPRGRGDFKISSFPYLEEGGGV